MTPLHLLSAVIAVLLAISATVIVRLGLWPASLPPTLLLGGVGALALLVLAWRVLSSMTGGRGAAPARAADHTQVLLAMQRDRIAVPEMSRRTGMPQDVIRGLLEMPSTRRRRSA